MSQIDRTFEEAERGRDLEAVSTVRFEALVRSDFEGVEERKLARIEFRKCYNVLPVVFREFEVCDLLSTRGNQFHDADRNNPVGNDI